MPEFRVRRSLNKLQAEYDKGNTEPLDKVIRAFKGIQELDPGNEDSFFRIAGYHGTILSLDLISYVGYVDDD